MLEGEPTLDLFGKRDFAHLVTDELPDAIALFERLEHVTDEALPQVEVDAITEQTVPGAIPRPKPGILDGIFD